MITSNHLPNQLLRLSLGLKECKLHLDSPFKLQSPVQHWSEVVMNENAIDSNIEP